MDRDTRRRGSGSKGGYGNVYVTMARIQDQGSRIQRLISVYFRVFPWLISASNLIRVYLRLSRSNVRIPGVSRSNVRFQPYRGPSLTRCLRRSLERDVSRTIDHQELAPFQCPFPTVSRTLAHQVLAEIIGTGRVADHQS